MPVNYLHENQVSVALAGAGQLVGASSCVLEGCLLESWSGHMPGYWFSPQSGHVQGATNQCFSLSPSPAPFLSLSIPFFSKINY